MMTRTLSRRTTLWLGSGGLAIALAPHGQQSVQATDASAREANTAIIRRVFLEPLSAGNVESVRDLYARDFRDRGVWARGMAERTGGKHLPGLISVPFTVVTFRERHPEFTLTVDPLFADADLVAAVATWSGPHPSAGSHMVGRTMHVFRLAQEQIIEEWSSGWEGLAPPDPMPQSHPTNPLMVPGSAPATPKSRRQQRTRTRAGPGQSA